MKLGDFIGKRIILPVSILILGSFSQTVFASVDGTFSGSTVTDLSCSSPSVPGGFPESTDITITLSTGTTSGIVNSVTMSSPHFTFTSTSSGTYMDNPPNPDGSINLFGSISGDMTVTFGDSNVDGSYPGGANFSFEAVFNTDGTLDLVVFTDLFFSGSPCSSGFIDFISLPSTLIGGSSIINTANGIQVNPELTPGSFITIPQVIKTQIRAITSDIHYRINDVLRVVQLRRKQFPIPRRTRDREREEEDSFLPSMGGNEDVVMDTQGQEDKQLPVQIRPTQKGFMMNTRSGMNAGDNPYLYGAWASYSYTDFDNEFAATAFDGDRHGGLGGVDVSPWENVLFGLAVGYESNDIDTTFNRGNQETDGYTIAPYVGVLLTDTWSADFSFGYSSLDTDQFRTLPGTTTRVTSSPDHDRWFWMLNVNGLTTYGNWIIGGKIGILYAEDEQDSYTESNGTVIPELDSELGQWNVGVDVAYSYGAYEPFARVTYENDYSQTEVGVIGGPQPSFDDDDVLLAFGLRYFGENNLSGNVEFNTRQGREDYDEYGFTATIRYEW